MHQNEAKTKRYNYSLLFSITIISIEGFLIYTAWFSCLSLYFWRKTRARINLDNIHGESIISRDGSLKSEKDFIRSLPNDGRFITYGLFANAVDAGMAQTTGHYFSRYQYNIWSEGSIAS